MFNVNIWGNVSDWAMVVVTIGTAVFLYLTFREQLRINKALLNQHKRQIRPYFKGESEFSQGVGFPPVFNLGLTDAPAIKVLIFDTDLMVNELPMSQYGFTTFGR